MSTKARRGTTHHVKEPTSTASLLATDADFQRWVLHPDEESERYWLHYATTHPEQRESIREARELVRLLAWSQQEQFRQAAQATRERILESISQPALPIGRPRSWWRQKPAWIAAASVVFLLLVVGAYWKNRPVTYQYYRTEYGTVHSIVLPDGSSVTLNAHSSIRYADNLANQPIREVWLTGEGFFSVRHTSSHQRFRVHTSRLEVDVLGTEFNLTDRPDRRQVVLQSGKVNVRVTRGAVGGPSTVTMKPGDLVELPDLTARLTQRRVNPRVYSSWRNYIWTLQNEPMEEVAQRINDLYGLEVQFKKAEYRRVEVSGAISARNLDDLIAVLEVTLKLHIHRTGNVLVVTD